MEVVKKIGSFYVLSRFEFFWIVLHHFEAVFGRLGSFWIVWERFGRLGLPNQIIKSQIRQPYFREPLLHNAGSVIQATKNPFNFVFRKMFVKIVRKFFEELFENVLFVSFV